MNPLGRIPTFVGADGFILSEAIAIAIYSPFERYFPSISPRPPPALE